MRRPLLLVSALAGLLACGLLSAVEVTPPASGALTLWYQQPAGRWLDAMALGNGRLGAMVFGGTAHERIGLIEDTLRSGSPYGPAAACPPATLAQIRKLLFCGRAKEAQDLADHALQGNPRGQASYQTIGELHLDFPDHEQGSGYRRDLDLDSATASVGYRVGETTFHREIFVSPIDQVVAVHLTADRSGAISFTAGFTTPQPATIGTAEGRTLFLRRRNGDLKTRKEDHPVSGGLTFESRVAVQAEGGSVCTGNDTLTVTGADSVTLLIASATGYVNYHDIGADPIARNAATLAAVADKPFTAIRAAHLAEHR